VDQVLADANGDGKLDVIGNVATGDVTATKYDGSNLVQYDSEPQGGENVDKSKIINLFENPIVANLTGTGPEVLKGGVTLNQVVNLGVAVGQNLPYNHVVQAWNARSGAAIPSFPQAVEDYQLLSSPSVADVSDAPGKELVVGTGLYYLRDINAAGVEGAGFPKFTGGWIFPTPAIGDVDGNGKLDITALTREGFAFRWTTDRPACGTNNEWWTSRHDEWSTGAYGTDTRPPGTPRAPRAAKAGSSVTLNWTAPGDDWLCGKARRYRVIKSTTPIQHPTQGTVVGTFAANAAAGGSETRTVTNVGNNVFFAVLYQDEAGNWGHLATARIPFADVSVSKADSPDPARVGQLLTYTVTVKNNGPATTGGVRVTDSLPGSTRIASVSTSQGACSRDSNTVTCGLGSLTGGSTATVTIVVKPSQAGTITNTATAASTQPTDPVASNNTATATTTVLP
jgi:uncharacterized repeat protein (TIGR01451 family)